MKIRTIVKFGVAALAMGVFFGAGLPVKADQLVWVRAQPLNYFKVRGLAPPPLQQRQPEARYHRSEQQGARCWGAETDSV